MSGDKKPYNCFTKGKYRDFDASLGTYLKENAGVAKDHVVMKDEILAMLCDIVKFDVTLSSYDKKKMELLREQTGKTTYELGDRKKYYERNKESLDKKQAEYMRKRRAAAKLET